MKDILARCSGWRWWGWVVTFFVLVELFVIFGPLYNFSILFVSLRKEFKSSAALTGSVGSLANGLVYFFSPVAGLLLRRFSPRTVVMSGVVVYSLGLLTTSFVPNIGLAFLTFGVLPAFGAGLLMHIAPRLLFEWYPKKHNVRAVSLGFLGTSVGMLSFAPFMNVLITHYGWRTTLKLLSGASLLIGLLSGLFLSPPPVRRRQSVRSSLSVSPTATPTPDALATITPLQADEREVNLVDKGTYVFSEESCLETEVDGNEQEIATQGDDSIRERVEKKEDIIEEMDYRTKGVKQALRSANAWLYSLSVIFAMIAWAFVIINMASFMKNLGFSTDQTSLVLVIIGVCEIAGKVVTALCGDHLPFLQILAFAASSLLGAVAAGFMIFANSITDMIILSVVIGVLRGIFFGIGFPAGFELIGKSYEPDTATNVLVMPWGVGFLIAAPLSGGLFDLTGDYTLSLLVLIGSFILSAACAVMVSIRRNVRSLNCCYRRSVDKEGQDSLNDKAQHSTQAGAVNEGYDVDRNE
ncbi:monocarboxylate transporter 13-like [Asterias amurensis]|uniref:monocarboxylate transporter 13-like n=1 Tax=Asterias amurensis TaxID=7602 RepID=UPI003AB20BE3